MCPAHTAMLHLNLNVGFSRTALWLEGGSWFSSLRFLPSHSFHVSLRSFNLEQDQRAVSFQSSVIKRLKVGGISVTSRRSYRMRDKHANSHNALFIILKFLFVTRRWVLHL